jgi:gliding-associated putative ABC transporter substrate-binding component GldG
MKENKSIKQKMITRFALLAIILVMLNIVSSKFHKQFDLTSEKRFSLSTPTKDLLKTLNEDVVIEVYLKGSFPAGFQRLQESTREVLQQFKVYGGNRIRFEFINPLEGKNEKEKETVFGVLANKGINPVNLQVQQDEDEGYSQKIIYPSALVSINGKEEPVNLLESHLSMSPDEKLHHASLMLEYKFASAIKKLRQPDKKKVAIVAGNMELLGMNTIDILYSLEKIYDLDTIDLSHTIGIPNIYTTAFIISPTTTFDEQNKFKLDQFVMHGGRILWCIEQLKYDMDSLKNSSATMAMDYNLNLEDMLFNYGVRINPDFIEDYQQANPIPVTVGMIGNQPDIKLLPWSYYPYSIPTSKHPIVNNMDAVMFMMASSIDTIANPEVKKTILLTSSNRSRRVPAPVRISLSNLKFKPTPEMFREANIPMAVLLEGKFKSLFANRIDPHFIKIYEDSLNQDYKTACEKENKMIVVSDGNVPMNDFSQTRGPMESGYYKFTEQMFANKNFILNCMEYLTEDVNLLEARSKSEKLRLLDMARIKNEKLKWQIINIGLPIALVLIFANAYFFFRKRKYEKK